MGARIVYEHSSGSKQSDTELIGRVRSGQVEAYAELWRRHRGAAITAARYFTSSLDAEDLVSEAYTQILATLQSGTAPGPIAFRPYLYTVVRNLARQWGATRREITVEEFPEIVDENDSLSIGVDSLDQGMVRDAFASLPTRWQEVLWYTEVEAMQPNRVGELLGISANSVSALAYRAREGLRTHWLQAHVVEAQRAGECHWALGHLGGHSRGHLSRRNQSRMEDHLVDCESCRNVAHEVNSVSDQIAIILIPAILGSGVGAAWLSSLNHGGGATVATSATSTATASVSVLSGAGTSSVIGVGATGVVTVGLVGALILGPAESWLVPELNPEHDLGPRSEVLTGSGMPGAAPGHESGSSDTAPATPDLRPPLVGQPTVSDTTGSTLEDVGDLLGATTDTVSELVGDLTGGLVTSDITVDPSLDSPSVAVGAGVGGLNVDASVDLSDEGGVDLEVGEILGVDLNLGGDDGLLGLNLFGTNPE